MLSNQQASYTRPLEPEELPTAADGASSGFSASSPTRCLLQLCDPSEADKVGVRDDAASEGDIGVTATTSLSLPLASWALCCMDFGTEECT